MSTLWTPSGEHEPSEGEPPGGPAPREASGPSGGQPGTPADQASRPEEEEQLRELRRELAEVPVADIVANHVVGLWQLAIVHLAPEGDAPPALEEARLAIDAVAALVDGLEGRLGQNETPLRDALAQLRLAFVEVSRQAGGGSTA